MRWTLIALPLMLAACGGPGFSETHADNARAICRQNGHVPGSAGFDACFAQTFSAIMAAYSPGGR